MSAYSYAISSSEELLAALLEIPVEQATEMIKEAGTIYNIPKRSDIPARFGVPAHIVQRLSIAIALADKARLSSDLRCQLTQAEKIAANFAELRTLDHEQLWIVYLNHENKMLRRELISKGDDMQTTMPTSFICRNAIMCNASYVIMVHNHPDGEILGASDGDRACTAALKAALETIGVRLLDHVIVQNGSYFSFAESKMIDEQAPGPFAAFGF